MNLVSSPFFFRAFRIPIPIPFMVYLNEYFCLILLSVVNPLLLIGNCSKTTDFLNMSLLNYQNST